VSAGLRPRTLAIAAHKGGVGKTTTAMALAAALARGSHGPVLLVDLDPQGHSTLGLGLDVDDEQVRQHTVRELLEPEPLPLEAVVHQTQVPDLSIVPATIRLEATAQILYGRPMRHAVLCAALERAAGVFAWIVIDCPPSLGPLVENALVAADQVLVPCRMEARATDGLADLIDVLRVLRGRAFDAWRILRTVVDSHNKVANAAIEGALRSKYDGELLETVIPKSEALNKAQIARMDIFAFDARSAGAEAYVALVEEIRRWQGSSTARV
jgi:chromosome partitioning protein